MNHSPLCRLTDHAADSMFFLSKSHLFPVLPIKFPGYPFSGSAVIAVRGSAMIAARVMMFLSAFICGWWVVLFVVSG
jgi:hypothetical protein